MAPLDPPPPPSTTTTTTTPNAKRIRKQCSSAGCTKVDAGGGFCVAHGGGKKCSFPGCAKGYQTGGFCRQHGGGARCQVAGCGKVDAGRGLCRAHGGGKRCQHPDCGKADVGGGRCTAHGGGRRCAEPGCTKIDQGGGRCRAHGGARRCRRRDCSHPARGATGLCSEHGGARVCIVPNCRRLAKAANGIMCAGCTAEHEQRMATEGGAEASEDRMNGDAPPSTSTPMTPTIPITSTTETVSHSPSMMTMMMSPTTPLHLPTLTAVALSSSSPSRPPSSSMALQSRVAMFPSLQNVTELTVSPLLTPQFPIHTLGQRVGLIPPTSLTPSPSLLTGLATVSSAPASMAATVSSRGEDLPRTKDSVASCLGNGCAKSYGGRCNCTSGCACCRPSSPVSRTPSPGAGETNKSTPQAPPSCIALQRVVLIIGQTELPRVAIQAILKTRVGVRSVNFSSTALTPAADHQPHNSSTMHPPRAAQYIMRCDPDFDVAALETLTKIGITYEVKETTTVDWAWKEVVVKVDEMMCPGNCGRTVMTAMRQVPNVQTANLMFDARCVIARGHMSAEDLCQAVEATGFEPVVISVSVLPKRFRFRVSDFVSLHMTGTRLKNLMMQVEGVESVIIMVDRAEFLVEATLDDATTLLRAALLEGFMMVELPESRLDDGQQQITVVPERTSNSALTSTPTSGPLSDSTNLSGNPNADSDHVCDVKVCPHNGCQQYMATVAHTAALAIGWAVPGCAMSWGGECTCGENCKCKGCPQHNPLT